MWDIIKKILQLCFSKIFDEAYQWTYGKLCFLHHFRNIKKKLDAQTVNILSRRRGIPFSIVTQGFENGIRNLLELNLIELETFPPREDAAIPSIYYYTPLGREFLSKNLSLKLYPEAFCRMYLLRFWKGYPNEFAKKTHFFAKKYKLSWEQVWGVFHKLLISQVGAIKEEDIVPTFDSYINRETFDSISQKIVGPWEQKAEEMKAANHFV